VGPEGSVLLLLVIAALWVLFDRVYPRVAYPTEDQRPADSVSVTHLL